MQKPITVMYGNKMNGFISCIFSSSEPQHDKASKIECASGED